MGDSVMSEYSYLLVGVKDARERYLEELLRCV
jgi:hypothetical protein